MAVMAAPSVSTYTNTSSLVRQRIFYLPVAGETPATQAKLDLAIKQIS
jgi:hypothetical protein